MTDGRSFLPPGTTLELDSGAVYRIQGEPIGWGGGSILYPARKILWQDGVLQTDGIPVVLKECYPVTLGRTFRRDHWGQILPQTDREEDMRYLHRAQLMQLEEAQKSQQIYQTASRMLPVRDASRSVSLTLPGEATRAVPNTVTVMDSLDRKGRSLTAWIKDRRRFPAAETFRILQQVLLALREVHQAGFLHLDIQDGNVFLRGTLADQDELVTLIDFGCAREMTEGKTAPIGDRVIFTTQGFSPPEILQHNDGTLRLGPEADLYSVGCLALYLLTGQRANVRELMANRTGSYLKPNHLRRVRCPKHLVGTMQSILARALAPEPEDRYPSADAMLADVADLAEALRPYRTDLSAVKYDAFVCYRHGPVDSAAALALQRALENYRSPRGVGGKRKPFGKVFVDEGELSSCADFGQQIREALKNSGWLIVICSPDTPGSVWVQQEIDTFLEYHDRSRILAVLTAGDRDQSFPPQLKGDAEGRGEVLAAHGYCTDAGEAARKMKGDTLLKLAAPMLGTTYDTLKQRQRIYRLQRLAVATGCALAVTAGFAAYAANRAEVIARQSARIQEEYQRSLRNESLFLAEQAERRLAENDPLGAMELALQALPSEDQDRPVLTEAVYALGKSLGIYRTPSIAENTVTPVDLIRTDCPYLIFSGDGSRLFAWNDSDSEFGVRIQCWQTAGLTLLWEQTWDHYLGTEPLLTEDGRLYVIGYHQIHCLEAETGQEYWTAEIPYIEGVKASADGLKLLVLSEDRDQPGRVMTILLDNATGQILQEGDFLLPQHMEIQGRIAVSEDLRYAAIPAVDGTSEEFTMHSYHSLYLADLETGSVTPVLDSQTEIRDMCFLGDMLAVVRSSGYTMMTQHNVLYQYDAKLTYWLDGYSVPDGRSLWSHEISDYMEGDGIYTILSTPYVDNNTAGDGVLYVFNDHCVLLDRQSGTLLRKYRLPAAALAVNLTEKGFETVNTDGTCTAVGFSIDTVMNIQYFDPGVSEVCVGRGVYFVQNESLLNRDHSIRKYQMNWWDDSYEVRLAADSNRWRVWGGHMLPGTDRVLLTEENRVCLADTKTGESWLHTVPQGYGFSEYRILGTSADGQRLYWSDPYQWEDPACWIDDSGYYCLDFETGAVELLTQPEEPYPYLTVWDTALMGDRMLLTTSRYEKNSYHLTLYSWDMTGNALEILWQQESAVIPEEDGKKRWTDFLYGSLQVDPETNRVTFALCENPSEKLTNLILVDPDSAEAVQVPQDLMPGAGLSIDSGWQKNGCQWNPAGDQLLLFWDSSIRVVDLDGNTVCILPGEQVISARYTPDGTGILTVTQEGVLTRYVVADPEISFSVDLTRHCQGMYAIYGENWHWDFPEEDTLLAVTNYGGFLIDLGQQELKMKAVIQQCIGYDADSRGFAVAETDSYSGKPTTLGTFPYYSTEDLIRRARSVLEP